MVMHMCDNAYMANASQDKVTSRLVVLLKPSEKKRLQSLARQEHVSSSEIVRRSLHTYSSKATQAGQEEEDVRAALAEMNEALDKALLSVRSARLEVAENIANIRKIRAGTV